MIIFVRCLLAIIMQIQCRIMTIVSAENFNCRLELRYLDVSQICKHYFFVIKVACRNIRFARLYKIKKYYLLG